MGDNCETDHYLVVTKVGESLAVKNHQHRNLMWGDLTSGN
jgi:hypothetical protein